MRLPPSIGAFLRGSAFVALCCKALGIVLLFSAVLKGIDIEAFAVQVSYYGITRNPTLVSILATALVLWELMLGSALVLGISIRRSAAALLATLCFFTLILLWAWLYRDLRNCGCFGRFLPMTPGEAIIKNIFMITLCIPIWRNYRKLIPTTHTFHKKITMASLVVCAAVPIVYSMGCLSMKVSAISSLPIPPIQTHQSFPPSPSSEKALFAKYSFTCNGSMVDLSTGSYLVCLLSDSCSHCAEDVAKLNNINDQPQLPRIIGLILGEEKSLIEFRQRYKPAFPLRLLPALEFFDLIGDAPPRFYLIRNGTPAFFWDKSVPNPDQISIQLSHND